MKYETPEVKIMMLVSEVITDNETSDIPVIDD